MSDTRAREVAVERMFAHLDIRGVGGATAVASARLGNEDVLTVRAGGPGIHSRPGRGPFDAYEVLLDHEPPRFWHRYGDMAGVLFALVPRLLIAHHINRRGGIQVMDLEVAHRVEVEALDVRLTLPPDMESTVLATLSALDGVQLVGSSSIHTNTLQLEV